MRAEPREAPLRRKSLAVGYFILHSAAVRVPRGAQERSPGSHGLKPAFLYGAAQPCTRSERLCAGLR
jgi:hypothetical protein